MPNFSRREFTALLAGAAAGLCAGCGAATTTLTPTDSQVTLRYADFPALAQVGGGAIIDVAGRAPIAVVRTGDSDAAALSATCTHVGCLLEYEAGRAQLHCNCHGADFTLDGTVLGGPTTVPLPTYAATVQPDAIVVDLS